LLTYTNTFRCSKNDAAIVAALFALKTARLAGTEISHIKIYAILLTLLHVAGMQSVCIHSQFKFVSGRVENSNFSGASHALLDNLRVAIAEIPNVSWVTKSICDQCFCMQM
jgi:hypothetical protein